jgi:hypothetical protein
MPEFVPQSTQQMAEAKKHHIYTKENGYQNVPYETREFPKWKYHATKSPVLVDNPYQEKRLGGGWQDAPFPDAEAVPSEEELRLENEQLRAKLAETRSHGVPRKKGP